MVQTAWSSTRLASPKVVGGVLLAAFAANCIAYLGWYALPEQWSLLAGELRLSQTRAAEIISTELTIAAVVSIIVSFLVASRAPRRLAAAGVSFVFLGNMLSVVASGVVGLTVSRFIAGTGEGLLWAMLNAALATLDDPDRRFAEVNAATSLTLALLVSAIPFLHGLHFARTAYIVLAVATLILSPLLIPVFRRSWGPPANPVKPTVKSPRIWALVIAMAAWGMVASTGYALADNIGQRAGLSEKTIGLFIGVSLIGIIAGSAAAGVISVRFGRLATLLLVLSAGFLAYLGLVLAPTGAGFLISLLAVNFCVYFALPFGLGAAAELDVSGGGAAASAGAFALGGGLSPVFGAQLVALSGYAGLAAADLIGSILLLAAVAYAQQARKALSD